MLRITLAMFALLSLAGCYAGEPIVIGAPPVYPEPTYPEAPPPGHGSIPPGQGGVPPGLAKKGGMPPGQAKKGYAAAGWQNGVPPWYYDRPRHGEGKGRRRHGEDDDHARYGEEDDHARYGRGGEYRAPYGIYRDTCYRERLGTALGALAGGAAGYQFGSGGGKAAAVVGGTIIGALIGGHIGRSMDNLDQNCVGQILEHAPPGRPITWDDGRDRYRVTPSQPYRARNGQYCREYQATATINGRPQQTYGTACRQPDGSWRLVN